MPPTMPPILIPPYVQKAGDVRLLPLYEDPQQSELSLEYLGRSAIVDEALAGLNDKNIPSFPTNYAQITQDEMDVRAALSQIIAGKTARSRLELKDSDPEEVSEQKALDMANAQLAADYFGKGEIYKSSARFQHHGMNVARSQYVLTDTTGNNPKLAGIVTVDRYTNQDGKLLGETTLSYGNSMDINMELRSSDKNNPEQLDENKSARLKVKADISSMSVTREETDERGDAKEPVVQKYDGEALQEKGMQSLKNPTLKVQNSPLDQDHSNAGGFKSMLMAFAPNARITTSREF